MKNVKLSLILQFLFLSAVPMVFGEIDINLAEKDVYNLGEKIVPVISMKKTPLLIPVQWVICSIQIQLNPLRWVLLHLNKDICEIPLDLLTPGNNLLVTISRRRLRRGKLQPVQRALSRQRLALVSLSNTILTCHILLANQGCH